MKNVLFKNYLFQLGLALAVFTGCETEQFGPDIGSNATFGPAVITGTTSGGTVVLDSDKPAENADTVMWRAAGYNINIPIRYQIQVSLTANFDEFEVVVDDTGDREAGIVTEDLNDAVLILGATPSEPTQVNLRVRSVIPNQDFDTLYSDPFAVTVTAYVSESVPLYMVGAGVPDAGWSWNNPVILDEIESGVWQGTTTFAVEAFRFFTVNGDWDSGKNYPYYEGEGYAIDANFENANDGDSNFRFIGTPGTYTITVNSTNRTITLE